MKSIMKLILLSLLSTIVILVIIFIIGLLFVPEIGLHITYPIRVLRGTDRYVGETRGTEVFLIWERIIIPLIFLSMMLVFTLLRRKRA
jgi:hypothetical protein